DSSHHCPDRSITDPYPPPNQQGLRNPSRHSCDRLLSPHSDLRTPPCPATARQLTSPLSWKPVNAVGRCRGHPSWTKQSSGKTTDTHGGSMRGSVIRSRMPSSGLLGCSPKVRIQPGS